MQTDNFDQEKKAAEDALRFAEETFGPDHPMVAARLEFLAMILRQKGQQLLEAANLEARARVIRSKYANEELLTGGPVSGRESSAADGSSITADNAMSRYTIIEKIGSGGMGTVYKARHDRIEKLLAVKVLSSEITNSKPARKRFEQEIQAACSLTHPHLVSVYDFGITDKGAPFLVMDFVDGVTLAEEIKGIGFIGAQRAVNIFIQLCESIAYAHSKGILHRDIKPSNVMLSESSDNERDFVKVVDFGLAKLMPSTGNEGKTMTSTADVMGSPLYMSPEQCLGEQLDERSDVYAIGCVMYEALTGKPPFTGGNTIKIIFQHLNADRGSLLRRLRKFKLPRGMEQIILRCLQKKAQDRYPNVSELLGDLQAVQSGRSLKPHLTNACKEVLTIAAAYAAGILIVGGIAAFALFARPTITVQPQKDSRTVQSDKDSSLPEFPDEVAEKRAHPTLAGAQPAVQPVPSQPAIQPASSQPAAFRLFQPTIPYNGPSSVPIHPPKAREEQHTSTRAVPTVLEEIRRQESQQTKQSYVSQRKVPVSYMMSGSGDSTSRQSNNINSMLWQQARNQANNNVQQARQQIEQQPNNNAWAQQQSYQNDWLQQRQVQLAPRPQLFPNTQQADTFYNQGRQQVTYQQDTIATYRSEIERKVQNFWLPPISCPNTTATLLVRLDSFGWVTDSKVISGEVDEKFEEAAKSAIRLASPFSPSPTRNETVLHVQFSRGRIRVI